MQYLAVIDTNVLVSAMLKISSIPGQVIVKTLSGEIIPLLNDEILSEYREVLHRPKFGLSPQQIDGLLDGIVSQGVFIGAGPIEEVFPDPKDKVFYEVVMEARNKEDAYLVTGNLKHFPAKSYVVTPREMLDIINGEVTMHLSDESKLQELVHEDTQYPAWEASQSATSKFAPCPEKNVKPYYVKETSAYLLNDATPYKLNRVAGFQHYKKQGEYTLDDYYEISENYLCELIDGCIYDRSSPKAKHQFLVTKLAHQIDDFIEEKGGNCMVIAANTDVHLFSDDKTVVQPDVMVICDPEKYRNGDTIWGAPDFVAEVLSPSTEKVDLRIKLHKYREAGVREYWIVDYQERSVSIYDFTGLSGTNASGTVESVGEDLGDSMNKMSAGSERKAANVSPSSARIDFRDFTDKVPMAIYDGECIIDFGRIHSRMEKRFDEYWTEN